MKRILVFLLLAVFLMAPGVLAHGAEDAAVDLNAIMAFEHSFAVILVLIAVVLGFKALSRFSGERKEPVMYLIIGVIAIGLIHLAEVLFEVLHIAHLPEGSMMHIEHILAYTALALFAIGFYKLKE